MPLPMGSVGAWLLLISNTRWFAPVLRHWGSCSSVRESTSSLGASVQVSAHRFPLQSVSNQGTSKQASRALATCQLLARSAAVTLRYSADVLESIHDAVQLAGMSYTCTVSGAPGGQRDQSRQLNREQGVTRAALSHCEPRQPGRQSVQFRRASPALLHVCSKRDRVV